MGIEPNSLPYDKFEKQIKIEFNPAKVGDDPFLLEMLKFLNSNSYLTDRIIRRIDLAIDIPVARNRLNLVKDGRIYQEYANIQLENQEDNKKGFVYQEYTKSISDKTQYLGIRNKHGFIKLYNKALESGLNNIDLTRLEITIDMRKSDIIEIQRLLPTVYIFDDFQLQDSITGTDKVLLIACINEPSLLAELPQVKKKKITSFLEKMKLPLRIDEIKYSRVLEEATNLIKY